MTINIKVCVYDLCLTLSLGHKLFYPATCTFLRKWTLNLCTFFQFLYPVHGIFICYWCCSVSLVYTLFQSQNISWVSFLWSEIISWKVLRTLHIGFIDFLQLKILFQLFSKFSWPFSACLRHCNGPSLQSTKMNFYLEDWKRKNWVAGQGFGTVEHAQNCL